MNQYSGKGLCGKVWGPDSHLKETSDLGREGKDGEWGQNLPKPPQVRVSSQSVFSFSDKGDLGQT